MRLKFYHILLSCGLFLVASGNSNLIAAETGHQVINPHWTGKYCEECHLDKKPQKHNAPLKFGGDPIQLCNRCHTKAFVTVEIHPFNVPLTDEMKKHSPPNWPLSNGKLNCLTCHDAVMQTYNDFPTKWLNPRFLRGAPYANKVDFCLNCHPKSRFEKENPHKNQLDAQGNIIKQSCLTCHETAPDPKKPSDMSSVSLKGPGDSICLGCHPEHSAGHRPEKGPITLSADMRTSLQKAEKKLHVKLPFINDQLRCGTCHNPHEKGVMQQNDAEYGAGEKYFLRVNGEYELCIICHAEKKVTDRKRQMPINREALSQKPPGVLVSHKPFLENKCKGCHEITPQHREKPDAVFLCFREGCHKPELLEKPYLHNKSVVGNCYACHESHASGYGKLLRANEEQQCGTCHPLFKDKNDQALPQYEKEQSNKIHRAFAAYLKTSAVPAGNECGFCHNKNHWANIGKIAPTACSGCHLYIKGMLQKNTPRPLNVHEAFREKLCSKCHDPHSGPHQYQLKNPPETYKKTVER
jgi:predicted CXXCH cytochrome family protein